MRPELLPPPDADGLERLRVHELVRDYPETLAVLLDEGVDPAATGGGELASVPDPRGRLRDRLLAALAWRRDGGRPES